MQSFLSYSLSLIWIGFIPECLFAGARLFESLTTRINQFRKKMRIARRWLSIMNAPERSTWFFNRISNARIAGPFHAHLYLRVAFILVLRLLACIMPNTTAANELWCDVWRCSDCNCACGIPACMGPGDVIWLAEIPLPSTQYVVIIPLPLTLISPRFWKHNHC